MALVLLVLVLVLVHTLQLGQTLLGVLVLQLFRSTAAVVAAVAAVARVSRHHKTNTKSKHAQNITDPDGPSTHLVVASQLLQR